MIEKKAKQPKQKFAVGQIVTATSDNFIVTAAITAITWRKFSETKQDEEWQYTVNGSQWTESKLEAVK